MLLFCLLRKEEEEKNGEFSLTATLTGTVEPCGTLKLLFTNTQPGQAEHYLIWVHIRDQPSDGFSSVNTSDSHREPNSICVYI